MYEGPKKRTPVPMVEPYCCKLGWLSTPPLLLKFSWAAHVLELLPPPVTDPALLVSWPLTNVSVGDWVTWAIAGTATASTSASIAAKIVILFTTTYLLYPKGLLCLPNMQLLKGTKGHRTPEHFLKRFNTSFPNIYKHLT